MIFRALIDAVIGAAIILAMAMLFLFNTPSHAAECGMASWYGIESGTHTATGERFTGKAMTAAMPDKKHLGERYRVTYRGKSVVVRINDIGPVRRLHRVMDLSKAAAAKLGMLDVGVARVCYFRVK